ncbi:MAG TPA: SagB family peptide dehydrogenase [Candidatus Baltobacteraceae bacterium]|nr:SagB family peptide dehydrogenase [Candidatus Baltobacteraceae bacterium]
MMTWPQHLIARLARSVQPAIDADGVGIAGNDGKRIALVGRSQQTYPWVCRFVTGMSAVEFDALGDDEATLAYFTFESLRLATLLEYAWVEREDRAVVRPFSETFVWHAASPQERSGVLDRFVYLEQVEGAFCAALPERACRIAIPDARTAALLWRLTSLRDAAATSDEDALRATFAAAGLMRADRCELGLRRWWEFPDALFHFRTRLVGKLPRRGGSFRFASEARNEPARKPPMSSTPVPVPVPALETRSGGLTRAMETRRSCRDFADEPMRVEQLAELLYRVARVVEFVPAGDDSRSYEAIRRTIPSGGAIGEIEFYACIGRCDGIERGLYHYDAFAHTLEPLGCEAGDVDRFLERAGACYGGPAPQALVILASRIPRRAWKYEATAYRNSLLGAGCALYALSLVATELGLSACPLGGGDVTLFASATGLDPYEESSVAEFALGTPSAATSSF